MERRMVGYVRVGPREPREGRPDPEDQRRAIEQACRERGWPLIGVEEEVRSGRTLRREGLRRAVATCRSGAASGIVVARLDRLTYSLADLAELVSEAVRGGYGIVSLDPAVDLESDAGQAVAEVLAAAAEWMPRGLSARARLLARRTRGDGGEPEAPRRPGRPTSTPPELARRIRAMRASGLTLQAICDTLNGEGVPTPRGGALWRPTSLRAILRAGGPGSAAPD